MAKQKRRFVTTFAEYFEAVIIGEGGSGQVFKVLDTDGKEFALKLLAPDRATKEKRARFRNELKLGEKTDHKNIITVVDHGVYFTDETESPFYVMEYYRKSLRDRIDDGIDLSEIEKHIADLLDGIEAAHELGIVHRDVKPENVLFDKTNRNLIIADFGIGRFTEEDLFVAIKTKDTTRLANFKYSAPEQREPSMNKVVDSKADIFAIGLIINEMFTGEIPQGAGYKVIGQVEKNYAYLDAVIEKMIQQDRSERYANVAEIKLALMGHKHKYIHQQELLKDRSIVVMRSENTDPLVNGPPQLVSATWDNGILNLNLSCSVNQKWIEAMQNMHARTSVMGKGPKKFRISGKAASIASDETTNQKIIDYFKQWLPVINATYKRMIDKEKEDAYLREKKAAEAADAFRSRAERQDGSGCSGDGVMSAISKVI